MSTKEAEVPKGAAEEAEVAVVPADAAGAEAVAPPPDAEAAAAAAAAAAPAAVDEESVFSDVSAAEAKRKLREVWADGCKVGEPTVVFKLVLPDNTSAGDYVQNIGGRGYNATIPRTMKVSGGDEIYLHVPESSAVGLGDSGAGGVEEDEDSRWAIDTALPGSDATFGNYVKRKLTKTVRTLTFGLVKDFPGFAQLGTVDHEGDYVQGQAPWDVDPTHPRPHLSHERAKAFRNSLSVRRKVERTEYKKLLKQVESQAVGCAGCKELKMIEDPERDPKNIVAERGDWRPYPFDTPIPFYKFPCFKIFYPHQWEDQSSPVDDCGIGVTGYFKLVKSLAVIFALMTIITAPALVMFSQSQAVPDREQLYSALVDSQKTLATSTISNLAEPIPICVEAVDTQPFKLQCPPNFYISSIIAYYGQPNGQCGCPYTQQVNPQNTACKGTVQTDPTTNTQSCAKATYGPYAGKELPCFNGLNRFGNRCCSKTQIKAGGNFVPDFSDLEISPNPDCNSATAPYIVHALCDGKNSCSFPGVVSSAQSFTFDKSKLLPYGPKADDLCLATSTSTSCVTTLGGSYVPGSNAPPDQASSGKYIFNPTGCVTIPPKKYSVPYYHDATNTNSFTNPSGSNVDFKLMVEAICQIDSVTIGNSAGSVTLTDEYICKVATNLNAIAILVFIFGVMWIQRKIENEHERAEEGNCTASDYTILVHTLPKDAKTKDEIKEKLTAFFQAQLHDEDNPVDIDIADINVTTGDYGYLDSLVQRGAASMAVDSVIGSIRSLENRGHWFEEKEIPGEGVKKVRKASNESHVKALKSALLRFEIANDKCLELSEHAEKTLSKAYVTFTHELGMALAVSKYPSIGALLTPLTQPEDVRLDGQTVFLERAPEPEEIIFENVSVPEWNRWLRFLTSTWLTLLCLAVSYAMIYEAKNVATLWQGYHDSIPCSVYKVIVSKDPSKYSNGDPSTITYIDVLYDYDPLHYGLNATSNSWGSYNYLQCYCSQVAFDAKNAGSKDPMAEVKAYTFWDDRSQTFKNYCNMMLSGSVITMAANYIATFVIVLVNGFLAFFMKFMVDFERHATETGRIMSMAIKLFLAQYINTAFLSLIIAGDISKAGGTNVRFSAPGAPVEFGIFTGVIQDYNVTWYASVGSSIMFTMFMFTIGNQPTVLIGLFTKWAARVWDRRWKFDSSVTHVETQEALDNLYVGPEIEMNIKYAALLTLIYVDLTYSATMPLFNIITFLNLVVMYASDKFLMFHLFKKPPVLNADLPRVVCKLLYFAAMIHVANGMWMFGNNAFYDPDISTKYSTTTATDNNGNTITALKVTHSWYQSIVYPDRIIGMYDVFLLAVLCLLGLMFALYLLDDLFLDVLGFKTMFMWVQKKCRRDVKDPGSVPYWLKWMPSEETVKDMIEGNPTYFEAIHPDAIDARIKGADLDTNIDAMYHLIRKKYRAELATVQKDAEDEKAAAESRGATKEELQLLDDFDVYKLAHKNLQEDAMREIYPAAGNLSIVDAADVDADADAAGGNIDGGRRKSLSDMKGIDTVKKGCFGNQTAANGCKEGTECAPGGRCAPSEDGCSAKHCFDTKELDVVEFTYLVPGVKGSDREDGAFEYRCMKGHESYNMNTVPVYCKKFGFESEHMDRWFSFSEKGAAEQDLFSAEVEDPRFNTPREKDWVLKAKAFNNPEADTTMIHELIRECMPMRVKKGDKMVIPWQAPLLDAYFGLCGGVQCVKGKRGCECLDEPDEEGVQPKWTNPFKSAAAAASSGGSESKAKATPATITVGGGRGSGNEASDVDAGFRDSIDVTVSASEPNPAADAPGVVLTVAKDGAAPAAL